MYGQFNGMFFSFFRIFSFVYLSWEVLNNIDLDLVILNLVDFFANLTVRRLEKYNQDLKKRVYLLDLNFRVPNLGIPKSKSFSTNSHFVPQRGGCILCFVLNLTENYYILWYCAVSYSIRYFNSVFG